MRRIALLLFLAAILYYAAIQVANASIEQPKSGTTFVVVEDVELHFAPAMLVNEHLKVGEIHQGNLVKISCHHNKVVNSVRTAELDLLGRKWYRIEYSGTKTGGAWVLARALEKVE